MKTIAQKIREEKLEKDKQDEVLEVYKEEKEEVITEEIKKEIKDLEENPDLFEKAEDLTKKELQDLAKEAGVEIKKSWNKTKLINILWGK